MVVLGGGDRAPGRLDPNPTAQQTQRPADGQEDELRTSIDAPR
jgi:hypothetical protein